VRTSFQTTSSSTPSTGISREHHCLADLLVRHAYAELGAEIVAVVSNHDHLHFVTEQIDEGPRP